MVKTNEQQLFFSICVHNMGSRKFSLCRVTLFAAFFAQKHLQRYYRAVRRRRVLRRCVVATALGQVLHGGHRVPQNCYILRYSKREQDLVGGLEHWFSMV